MITGFLTSLGIIAWVVVIWEWLIFAANYFHSFQIQLLGLLFLVLVPFGVVMGIARGLP